VVNPDKIENYLDLSSEEKGFLQSMIHVDYLQLVNMTNRAYEEEGNTHRVDALEFLYNDLLDYEYEENYEICQLYKDIIKRYYKNG
jgi:hypothetical protein